jgi:ribonuclease P protein component
VSERLRRSDRVLLSRDFQRVSRQGIRVSSRDFVMLVAPGWRSGASRAGEGPAPRLGVTASRKVGGAVVRNRVKRSIREWFRRSRARFEGDVDIVVIARPGAACLDCGSLRAELSGLAEKAAARGRGPAGG